MGCLEILITIGEVSLKILVPILILLIPGAILLAVTGGTAFEPFPGQGLPPHGTEVSVTEYWCCTTAALSFACLLAIVGFKRAFGG